MSNPTRHAVPRTHLAAGLALALGLSLPVVASSQNSATMPLLPPDAHLSDLGEEDSASTPLIPSIASGDTRMQDFADSDVALDSMQPAAIWTVSNCNPHGPGSLPYVLTGSENGDVIDMSQLSCSHITLGESLALFSRNLTFRGRLSGDLRLPIITISSNFNGSGIFNHWGEGATNLRIEQLSIRGDRSRPTTSRGGCIYSQGSVHLVDSHVKYCAATASGHHAYGGAVYAEGDVTLTRSEVVDSTTHSSSGRARGGGIFAYGKVYAFDSLIYGNRATSDSGTGRGGGVYAEGGAFMLRTKISSNTATYSGGMEINTKNANESVWIKHALMHGNRATADSGEENSALAIRTAGDVTLLNSTIARNINVGWGAALGIKQAGSVRMDSNIVSANRVQISEDIWWRDFDSRVAITGSQNLLGRRFHASVMPPADSIRQEQVPLDSSYRPARGSWAFNRGQWLSDIVGFIPPSTYVWEPAWDHDRSPREVGAGVDIGALESDALFVDGFANPPRGW